MNECDACLNVIHIASYIKKYRNDYNKCYDVYSVKSHKRDVYSYIANVYGVLQVQALC